MMSGRVHRREQVGGPVAFLVWVIVPAQTRAMASLPIPNPVASNRVVQWPEV